MDYDLLLQRISERLAATGISERSACIKAGVGLNTVRHIRKRGHAPKPENLRRLAEVLGVPASYFLEATVAAPVANSTTPVLVQTIYVKGAVQAGAWQEALEWPSVDWTPIYAPEDPRYPGIERFGLLVRGNSMNRVYPDGSVVIAVKFSEIGRMPQSGERVIVMRRASCGMGFEATVKKFEIDSTNRLVLWPESSDPDYQQPIILNNIAAAMSEDGHDGDHAASLDLEIVALVVGSYRSE